MLDRAQIDDFHRDGFLIIRGLIRGRELDLLREASQRVIDEGVARLGDDHIYAPAPDGSERYWRSERMWQRDPIFQAVAVHPQLLEAIGMCLGHEFFPWNDSLVVKLPGGPGVSWHQDPPYSDPARTATYGVPNFTTDIYLDDSDEDNGCVWAIPGHHLVGHVRYEAFSEEDLFTHCGAVPVRMRAGDVLLHALSTPHGSRANHSQRMRRTFYIHYIAQLAHTEAGYGGWDKKTWDAGMRDQVLRMAADRERLGLSPAFGSHVVAGEQGLRITGLPATPPLHWGDLAKAIAPARRAQLQAVARPAQHAGAKA